MKRDGRMLRPLWLSLLFFTTELTAVVDGLLMDFHLQSTIPPGVISHSELNVPSTCYCKIKCIIDDKCSHVAIHDDGSGTTNCFFSDARVGQLITLEQNPSAITFSKPAQSTAPSEATTTTPATTSTTTPTTTSTTSSTSSTATSTTISTTTTSPTTTTITTTTTTSPSTTTTTTTTPPTTTTTTTTTPTTTLSTSSTTSTTTTTVATTTAECANVGSVACLKPGPGQVTGTNASAGCGAGETLYLPQTQNDFEGLTSFYTANPGLLPHSAWVNMRNKQWTNNVPVKNKNWANTQPSSVGSSCAIIDVSQGFLLKEHDCGNSQYSLCIRN
ncbi:integumentary mucin C.1-like [Macrobrachium nipponense]|uniref:integumentary mucin C.1-like n=1 Tax=Macrobrachium nipponense TaxID=159736 RepID=UPI0030C88980